VPVIVETVPQPNLSVSRNTLNAILANSPAKQTAKVNAETAREACCLKRDAEPPNSSTGCPETILQVGPLAELLRGLLLPE
jgi:hypothetical protein